MRTHFILIIVLLLGNTSDLIAQKITEQSVALKNSIWDTNSIKVCWENPSPNNETERNWVKDAISNSIENESLLRFTGWQQCQTTSKGIRIKIADEGPHVKKLGKHLDGIKNGMVLNFTFNNWSIACSSNIQREFCIRAIAIHEFMHAIGFAHEQNRDFCYFPDCLGEEQGQDGDYFITPCDLNSIMNYCNPNWNNDGNLSDLDIQGLKLLYDAKTDEFETNGFNSTNGSGNIGLMKGDVNGDGKTDIIQLWNKPNYQGKKNRMAIITYLSQGNGQYTSNGISTTNGSGNIGLMTGDVNGDGKTDIIQLWNKPDYQGKKNRMAIITYLSQGNGQYTSNGFSTTNGSGNIGLMTGDVNGDGKTDIIQLWKNGDTNRMSIITYLSEGNGQYTSKGFSTTNGSGNIGLMTGDVNGDGKTDIIQLWNKPNYQGKKNRMAIITYLSQGNGQYTSKEFSTTNGSGNIGLMTGDVNGDGKTDIIQLWKKGDTNRMSIITYLSEGNGQYNSKGFDTPQGAGNTGIFTGDINNDGMTDFIQSWRRNSRMNFISYKSNGDGTYFTSGYNTNQGYGNIGMTEGDVNGDGKIDIIQLWNKPDYQGQKNRMAIISYLKN